MKIVGFSFHSLEFLVCLDSLSASGFIDPGKNSAVIVNFRFKRYCQISLLIAVNSWFLVPHIFIKYDRAVMWSMRMWTDTVLHLFPLMWRALWLIWLPWAPIHLCEIFVPPKTMALLLSGRDNLLLSIPMMYLSLLLFEVGKELKISLCREFNFLSTITDNSSFLASTEIVTFSLKELWQINFWICWFWRWR